jgi:hypothetical protein
MSLTNTIKKYYNKVRFTRYFKNNTFGSNESVSGEGSTLEQTLVLKEVLPQIFRDFGVKTIIDAPCGDFNWMRYVDLSMLDSYLGLDIVNEIVVANNEKHGNHLCRFEVKDISNDYLIQCDLILCRDCLVHLTFKDALKVIKNFKNSGAKYLLSTSFVGRSNNQDLGIRVWRTLNLSLAPFNFPEPLLVINENCTEGNNMFSDKSLVLYDLSQIII